jgi:hypothetical protein
MSSSRDRGKIMQPHREIAALLRTIVRCNPLNLAGVKPISTAEIHDWRCFVSQVGRHRITPLCSAVLKGTGTQLPREAETMLTHANERHFLLNFARAAELLQVLDAFQAARIDAMAFKGVALGVQLYDDFNLRAAGDLDLLVRWEDLSRASEIILGRGYRLTTPLRPDGRPIADGLYEYHFERASDGMILELHWNLNFVHPRFPHSIGLERIGQFSQAVQLAGREVRVPDAETTLLLLCMHGTKHQWSRLNWVCDVAQLLRRSPNLDWDRIEAEAKQVGLRKAVALGLLLAHSLCGVACPAEAIWKLDSFPSVRTVAERLAGEIPEPTGQEGGGFIRFHARLMDRPDLLRFLFSRDAIRPTANDEAFLSLPPSLRWLHVLIRPFRLLMERSAR